MKKIETKFPIFAQIENNDDIFLFNAMCNNPLQTIKKIQVRWYDGDELIDADGSNNFRSYITKDLMLKSHCVSIRGEGFATTFETAKKAIMEIIEEQISIEQKEIDRLNRHISIAQSDIEKYRKAIESLY